jgi:hypothetical protein
MVRSKSQRATTFRSLYDSVVGLRAEKMFTSGTYVLRLGLPSEFDVSHTRNLGTKAALRYRLECLKTD